MWFIMKLPQTEETAGSHGSSSKKTLDLALNVTIVKVMKCMFVFLGHGFLTGGASPAGDPRPSTSLLHQPGRPADAGAQKLRNAER